MKFIKFCTYKIPHWYELFSKKKCSKFNFSPFMVLKELLFRFLWFNNNNAL